MLRLSDCKKDGLCVDCKDEECLLSGKIMSDCSKYDCDNKRLYDCEHCDFIKQYQKNFRENQMNTGGNKNENKQDSM